MFTKVSTHCSSQDTGTQTMFTAGHTHQASTLTVPHKTHTPVTGTQTVVLTTAPQLVTNLLRIDPTAGRLEQHRGTMSTKTNFNPVRQKLTQQGSGKIRSEKEVNSRAPSNRNQDENREQDRVNTGGANQGNQWGGSTDQEVGTTGKMLFTEINKIKQSTKKQNKTQFIEL